MLPRIRSGLLARFTLAAATLAGALGVACGGDSATGPLPFEKAAYVRSAVGGPWHVTTNEDAMNQAFGAGSWDDLRFETANPDSLLTRHTFLYLDGSDDGAIEMEAFIAANQTALESFVNRGGRVLINSAPNEGDGMSFGFGVSLAYNHMISAVEAADPVHPIFVATDSTRFTGHAFAHATVTGANLRAIIQHTGAADTLVLAEKVVGRGRALFGAMTTDNFHDPQPAAHTLRINILRYAAGVPLP